jgi:hypothetical protein
MELTPLARELYEAISELTIIDAHEHLPDEADYLAKGYSGFNMFANYFRLDLVSAGLDATFAETMRDDTASPPEDWWPKIRPFYEAAKHTSYGRALRITARDLYGVSDINDRTIGELAAKVRADNTPGLYRRVLQERCGIRYSITCLDSPGGPGSQSPRLGDDPGLRAITRLLDIPGQCKGHGSFYAERNGRRIETLDDLAEAAQTLPREELADGAVGFKLAVGDYAAPDPAAAAEELNEELRGHCAGLAAQPALRDWLLDKLFDVAVQADVPVAVHTGYWGDFRRLDPKFMLGFAARRAMCDSTCSTWACRSGARPH